MTYLNGELFSFMTPLFVMIFAIGLAAAQIAGEEENGTLSLLLAYPVSRDRLLAQKYGVLVDGHGGALRRAPGDDARRRTSAIGLDLPTATSSAPT